MANVLIRMLLFFTLTENAYGTILNGPYHQIILKEKKSDRIRSYLIYSDSFRVFRDYSLKPNNFQIISKYSGISIEITYTCNTTTCKRNNIVMTDRIEKFNSGSAMDDFTNPQPASELEHFGETNCELRISGAQQAQLNSEKLLESVISQNIVDQSSCNSVSQDQIVDSFLALLRENKAAECISNNFDRSDLFIEIIRQMKQGNIPFKFACTADGIGATLAKISLPQRIMTFTMPQKDKYCLAQSIAHETLHFADAAAPEAVIRSAERCYSESFPCIYREQLRPFGDQAGVELAHQQANIGFKANMQSTDVIIPADPQPKQGESYLAERGTPAFAGLLVRYADRLVERAFAQIPGEYEGNTTGRPQQNLSGVPRSSDQQPKGSVALLKRGSGQISELRAGQNPALSVNVLGETAKPADGNFKIGIGISPADEEVLKLRPGPGLKNIGDARAANTKTAGTQSIEKSSPQPAIADRAPASAVSGKPAASQIAPDGSPRAAPDSLPLATIVRQVINDLNYAKTPEEVDRLSAKLERLGIQLKLNKEYSRKAERESIGAASKVTYSFVQKEDNKLQVTK